jgi:RND superfamily putative drug exporter
MAPLTRWVLAHRRLVAAFWVVATLASLPLLGQAIGALSNGFALPGKEGFETNERIARTFGNGGGEAAAPLVPVVTVPAGQRADTAAVQREFAAVLAGVERAVPGARVASYESTRNPVFLSKDRRTTYAYVFFRAAPGIDGATPAVEAAREELSEAQVAGAAVSLTGISALRAASDEGGGAGPGLLVEVALGAGGALVVLVLVFRSALAFVPLLMAFVAIPAAFMLIWALTALTDVSAIVQFLVALIGLGVAIDYALLIVLRWREECDGGAENEAAVVNAMRTAGSAVVFSGLTVAIGLLALVALPVPFLRSVGYGGLLIPIVSVLVACTLLPVVLATVGPRLDRRRLVSGQGSERRWQRWGEAVVRRRVPAAVVSGAILVALLIPALSISPGDPVAAALDKGGSAGTGLAQLERSGITAGALTPTEVLVPQGATREAAERLAAVPGVRGAVAPEGAQWSRDGVSIVDVVPASDAAATAGKDTLERVRAAAADLPGAGVGGLAAETADFVDAVYGSFPLMLAIISVVTFILLARAFRSLLLPAKAVVFNILSVGAVWGFLVFFWQNGFGGDEIFGVEPTGAITAFVPLMVFAFLYGISMDYEVFVVSRMREEYDRTGDTDLAAATGIAKTGRLVTSAAMILFLAFVALASAPETDIRIFATALAVGVILDATLVRSVLLPASISLFGRWNWWMPDRLARLLRASPHRNPQGPGQPSGPPPTDPAEIPARPVTAEAGPRGRTP